MAKNSLDGVTLENMLTSLQQHFGWDELASKINIKCFKFEPSIKSSLKFLRKTDWARAKVERLYQNTNFAVQPKQKQQNLKKSPHAEKEDPWAAHRKK